MTPGSVVCPGAAVWVWLQVCLCASEPVCADLCDHCCTRRLCVELCVCVFLDAQLCRNLCSVWVAGALVSLQARLLASSSLLSPPPPTLLPSETVFPPPKHSFGDPRLCFCGPHRGPKPPPLPGTFVFLAAASGR